MQVDPSRIGQIHTATDGRDILLNDPDGWEVGQPWLWHDGPAGGDGTGGPWGNPPPGAEFAAPTRYGLSLPAVTRSVQLLADKIASMPWKTYQGREQLVAPAWISDPQALISSGGPGAIGPDVRFSAVEFWTQYITSLVNWGEGIAYTPRELDAFGQPTGPIVAPIYNLHPAYVEVDAGRYLVEDETSPDGYTVLDPRELIVTRYMVRPGRERGVGVIQAHAADLGLAANMREYADNLFQRGVPNGYLKSSKPDLDQAAANKLKESWMKSHGNVRKSIAVLNATTDFQSLTLDPAVVQFVEMNRVSAWQIALMFGIPPSKLGVSMGQSNTYSNLESENTAFVQDSLLPIARKIESAFNAALPEGTSLKIDFNQLLRGDTTTRYAAYQTGLAAGFLTMDEVRGFEDLPPLPSEPSAATADPREIAEIVQKVYLGVGPVLNAEEARDIVNMAGAGLTGPAPAPEGSE